MFSRLPWGFWATIWVLLIIKALKEKDLVLWMSFSMFVAMLYSFCLSSYCIYCVSAPILHRESTASLMVATVNLANWTTCVLALCYHVYQSLTTVQTHPQRSMKFSGSPDTMHSIFFVTTSGQIVSNQPTLIKHAVRQTVRQCLWPQWKCVRFYITANLTS